MLKDGKFRQKVLFDNALDIKNKDEVKLAAEHGQLGRDSFTSALDNITDNLLKAELLLKAAARLDETEESIKCLTKIVECMNDQTAKEVIKPSVKIKFIDHSDRITDPSHDEPDPKHDINHEDEKKNTALHLVSNVDAVMAIEMLCKFGANINLRNHDGHTPAHIAARKNNKKTLCLLVQLGAKYKDGLLGGSGKRARIVLFTALFTMIGGSIAIFLLTTKVNESCLTFYDNIILQPFLILFANVFLFKVFQFVFEKQFMPGLDFVIFCMWYGIQSMWYGIQSMCSRSIPHVTREKQLERCAICLESHEEVIFERSGVHRARVMQLYNYCFDKDEKVLQRWRYRHYLKVVYSDFDFYGWEAFIQPPFLFLYLQVLVSIIMLLAIAQDFDTSVSSWQQYLNFYALVVNSCVPSTAFSLVKMAFFDMYGKGRLNQMRRVQRSFSYTGQILWTLYVCLPWIILIPPILTHIIPGIFLYIWLVALIALIYLVLLCLTKKNIDKMKQTQGKNIEDTAPQNDYINACIRWVMKELCVAADEREELFTYFFWFFLEIFTRFVFIFLFQVIFDYVTIVYLSPGLNSENYWSSIGYASQLRSQSRCYVAQSMHTAHGLIQLLQFI